MTSDQATILEAIRALPRDARVRIFEELKADLTEQDRADGRSVVGLFAHEAELIEQVCREAMEARERDPLRVIGK